MSWDYGFFFFVQNVLFYLLGISGDWRTFISTISEIHRKISIYKIFSFLAKITFLHFRQHEPKAAQEQAP